MFFTQKILREFQEKLDLIIIEETFFFIMALIWVVETDMHDDKYDIFKFLMQKILG